MENLVEEIAEQIVKLNEENKVLKKALELACINIIHYEGDDEEEFCAEIDNAKNYFIDQVEKGEQL